MHRGIKKLSKLKTKKLYEEIAEIFKERIMNGELEEGERLPSIEKLAKEFGVGQASIREALNTLRGMGLLDIRHGQGTFVKANKPKVFTQEMSVFKKKDIIDLLEVRKIIEVASVRMAALNRSSEHLAEIKETLEQMQQAVNDNQLGEQSDLHFHLAIAKASGNQLLVKLLTDVSDVMKTTMKETRSIWVYNGTKSIEKLYKEHLEIYLAIESMDVSLSEQKMNEHLSEVEQVLIDNLQIS